MARLTEKHYNGQGYYLLCSGVLRCDNKCDGCPELEKAIDRLGELEDAAEQEPAPVVHGRWETELMPTGVEYTGYQEMTVQALSCSVCGKCIDVSEGYFSCCPNCGAKMDKQEENHESNES